MASMCRVVAVLVVRMLSIQPHIVWSIHTCTKFAAHLSTLPSVMNASHGTLYEVVRETGKPITHMSIKVTPQSTSAYH